MFLERAEADTERKNMLKNIFYSVFGLFLVMSLSGCILLVAGVAGGAGTAFWLSGKLTSEISAPYEKTVQASKKAIQSLDMEINKETTSSEVTQLRSQYSDGSEVWIDVRPLTASTSKVEIRVGLKGNKEASSTILERIKKYL